jgi:flagellar motor switch protein FliN/FliY
MIDTEEPAAQDAIDQMFSSTDLSTSEPAESMQAPTPVLTDLSELDAVYDVPVQVSAVLGKATIPVNQLLKLGRGAVVELDRRIGEAIDIFVNNRLIARGEVVLVEDRLGVTMTEIIKSDHVG